jgi:HlyD family secretion protein
MKNLPIYTLISSLSLATCFTLSAADPAPSKKAAVDSQAKTKTSTKAKPGSSKSSTASSRSKPAAPTTHTLKKGLFEIKVELSGIFEAVKSSPIKLTPKSWGYLSVIEAAPHGAEVKKGDVILRLEIEKLEKSIRKAELGRPLSDLSLKLAELELVELEKSTPMSLASRRRSKMQAEEDLAYFEETDRAHREKSATQNMKSSVQYLSYAKEELDQLKKMYAADDLTEETEEIIVTRAKNSVETAAFRMESMKLSTARTLNTSLPRQHQGLRDQAKSSSIAWEKSSKSLPQSLKMKRLELEKIKRDRIEADEKLNDMKTDLASFTIKAPHDGVVYYGANVRGKWATATLAEKKLVPGGKLMPHEIFMTVVQTQPLQIQTSIPENKLSLLKNGLATKITPTSLPDGPLKGELASMNRIPLTTGGFPGTVKILDDTKNLYPGMSCKILFEVHKNENALTVPVKAVSKEKGKSYVRLKDGKKREVTTGRSDGKSIEILSGLKEGETVKL